mgnify:CR=1 FL=1
MKVVFLSCIFLIFTSTLHASEGQRLKEILAGLENAQSRLAYLQDNESIYLDQDLAIKAEYWLSLGLALEENNQLNEALSVYNRAVTTLEPAINSHRELYINALIQRSYITYLQTYDTKKYCPDRALAYNALDETISVDMQVRANVQYAFCFQNGFEMQFLELHKVYRQEGRHFLRLLEAVRLNRLDFEDLEDLNERYDPNFEPPFYFITLSPRNAAVDRINNRKLDELEEENNELKFYLSIGISRTFFM